MKFRYLTPFNQNTPIYVYNYFFGSFIPNKGFIATYAIFDNLVAIGIQKGQTSTGDLLFSLLSVL